MSPFARAHAAMLCVSALVAGSFNLGALAAPHIAPLALNGLRFVIATALMWLLLVARGEVIPAAAREKPWRYLVLGGIFSLYFVLMFEGLKTAAPVSAAAVYATTPAFTAIFGLIILGQRQGRGARIAITIGAVGALWVVYRGDIHAALSFRIGRGEAIYFVGCLAHALYIPLVRLLNRGERASIFTLGTLIGATVAIVGAGIPAIFATDWAALPGIVWVTIVYTAVFATAASIVLTQYASLVLPAANVMAYIYLVPVWVILNQIVFGQGAPEAVVLPGIALIVVSLVILLRLRRG